ncbi:tetratricopeptide repeat protein [Fibrobacterota bacterium]
MKLRDKTSDILSLSIILLAGFIALHYTFEKKLDLNGDNVTYFLLGKALSTGQGYVNIQGLEKTPHTGYPPGFPLLISLVAWFTGDELASHIVGVKILVGMFFLVSMVLGFFIFKASTGDAAISLAGILIIMCNAHLLRFSSIMMTEIPNLLCVFWVFFCFTKTDLNTSVLRDRWYLLSLLGLALGFYFRTQGVAIAFAAVVYLLAGKKWRYLFATISVYTAMVLPWFIRGKIYGGSPYIEILLMKNPYDASKGQAGLGDMVARIFGNIARYINAEIPHALVPRIKLKTAAAAAGWESLLSICVLSLCIYALFRLKKLNSLWFGYLAGIFGICFLWSEVWFGPRFIISVIPILLFLGIYGLWDLLRRIFPSAVLSHRFSPLLLLPLCLLSVKPVKALHDTAMRPYPPNWLNYFKVANWVKRNTPEQTLVSCRKPGFFYLFSDRQTTPYLFSWDRSLLLKDMLQKNVDYVVVEQLGYGTTPKYLVPAIKENPGRFSQVLHLERPHTYLFQVKTEKTREGRLRAVAASFNVQAFQHLHAKNLDSAREFSMQSIAVLKKNDMVRDFEMGNAFDNLGSIYFSEKKFKMATKFWLDALKVYSHHQGRILSKAANTQANLGLALFHQDKIAEGAEYLKKSLKIRETIFDKNHMQVAHSLNNLGFLLMQLGDYKQAEMYLKRLVEVLKTHYKKQLEQLGFASRTLLSLYLKTGQKSKGKSFYNGFLVFVKNQFGSKSPQYARELKQAAEFFSKSGMADDAGVYLKEMELMSGQK